MLGQRDARDSGSPWRGACQVPVPSSRSAGGRRLSQASQRAPGCCPSSCFSVVDVILARITRGHCSRWPDAFSWPDGTRPSRESTDLSLFGRKPDEKNETFFLFCFTPARKNTETLFHFIFGSWPLLHNLIGGKILRFIIFRGRTVNNIYIQP